MLDTSFPPLILWWSTCLTVLGFLPAAWADGSGTRVGGGRQQDIPVTAGTGPSMAGGWMHKMDDLFLGKRALPPEWPDWNEMCFLKFLELDTFPETPWGGRWVYVPIPEPKSLTFLGFDRKNRLRAQVHYPPGASRRVESIYDDWKNDTVIGHSSADLLWATPWTDNALGRLVAGALRESGRTDVGLVNPLGLRDNIPKGIITRKHIVRLIPYDNMVYRISLPGRVLRQFILETVGDRRELHFSGVVLRYWPDEEQFFKVGGELIRSDGSKIHDTDMISVAIPSYVADSLGYRWLVCRSEEEFWEIGNRPTIYSKIPMFRMREAVEKYVRNHSTLVSDPRPSIVRLPDDELLRRLRTDVRAQWDRLTSKGRVPLRSLPCAHDRRTNESFIPSVSTYSALRTIRIGESFWAATPFGVAEWHQGRMKSFCRHREWSGIDIASRSDIRDLVEVDGKIWIVTRRAGIFVFDPIERKEIGHFFVDPDHVPSIDDMESFRSKHSKSSFPASNLITQVIEDPYESLIWIGTMHGVYVYDKAHSIWMECQSAFRKKKFQFASVRWIVCTPKHVWIVAPPSRASAYRLLRFDRTTRSWTEFRNDIADTSPVPEWWRLDEGLKRMIPAPDTAAPGMSDLVNIGLILASSRYVWVSDMRDSDRLFLAEYDAALDTWQKFIGPAVSEPRERIRRAWPADVSGRWAAYGSVNALLEYLGIPRDHRINSSRGVGSYFTHDQKFWLHTDSGAFVESGAISDAASYIRILSASNEKILLQTDSGVEIIDLKNWRRLLIPPPTYPMSLEDLAPIDVDGIPLFTYGMGMFDDADEDPPVLTRGLIFHWDTYRWADIQLPFDKPAFRYLRKFYPNQTDERFRPAWHGRSAVIVRGGILIK